MGLLACHNENSVFSSVRHRQWRRRYLLHSADNTCCVAVGAFYFCTNKEQTDSDKDRYNDQLTHSSLITTCNRMTESVLNFWGPHTASVCLSVCRLCMSDIGRWTGDLRPHVMLTCRIRPGCSCCVSSARLLRIWLIIGLMIVITVVCFYSHFFFFPFSFLLLQ